MSHWNHRVIRFEYEDVKEGASQVFFTICETHYDDEGRPYGYSEPEHNPLHSESPDDLRVTLERMLAALDKPVLADEDMVGNLCRPLPRLIRPLVPAEIQGKRVR